MARDDSKVARTTRSGLERRLADIAERSAGAPPEAGAATPIDVELVLGDLVADDRGEIVFFNDSGFRSLTIRTDRAILAEGRAAAHVTAAGDDVSGFKFVTFDNGSTLYFEEGLDLIVISGTGTPPA